MKIRLDDYIDGDIAYFLGLMIGHGTINDSQGIRHLTIEFSYSLLQV